MNGVQLSFSKETKYLGVILDDKLNWKSQIQRIKEKAIRSLMACKNLLGRRWGLKPAMVRWLYLSVTRPMMTYGSYVWWPKLEQRIARAELTKVQRIACLAITGAIRSTPTVALEAMLDLTPIYDVVMKGAAMSAFRDTGKARLRPGDMKGHM